MLKRGKEFEKSNLGSLDWNFVGEEDNRLTALNTLPMDQNTKPTNARFTFNLALGIGLLLAAPAAHQAARIRGDWELAVFLVQYPIIAAICTGVLFVILLPFVVGFRDDKGTNQKEGSHDTRTFSTEGSWSDPAWRNLDRAAFYAKALKTNPAFGNLSDAQRDSIWLRYLKFQEGKNQDSNSPPRYYNFIQYRDAMYHSDPEFSELNLSQMEEQYEQYKLDFFTTTGQVLDDFGDVPQKECASPVEEISNPQNPDNKALENRLSQAKYLLEEGLIDEAEYKSARERILKYL